jgi:hypothetical protein
MARVKLVPDHKGRGGVCLSTSDPAVRPSSLGGAAGSTGDQSDQPEPDNAA